MNGRRPGPPRGGATGPAAVILTDSTYDEAQAKLDDIRTRKERLESITPEMELLRMSLRPPEDMTDSARRKYRVFHPIAALKFKHGQASTPSSRGRLNELRAVRARGEIETIEIFEGKLSACCASPQCICTVNHWHVDETITPTPSHPTASIQYAVRERHRDMVLAKPKRNDSPKDMMLGKVCEACKLEVCQCGRYQHRPRPSWADKFDR